MNINIDPKKRMVIAGQEYVGVSWFDNKYCEPEQGVIPQKFQDYLQSYIDKMAELKRKVDDYEEIEEFLENNYKDKDWLFDIAARELAIEELKEKFTSKEED